MTVIKHENKKKNWGTKVTIPQLTFTSSNKGIPPLKVILSKLSKKEFSNF